MSYPKLEEIISDKEIESIHGHANFGGTSKRDVIKYALLKRAFGHYDGYTATQIIKEHGLVRKDGYLTKKGFLYLQASFSSEDLFKGF